MVGTILYIAFTNATLAAPEAPIILRDVHLTEKNAFTRPSIPAVTTSSDGRIALSHLKRNGYVEFRLQKPEKFMTHFSDSPNGAYIFNNENNPVNKEAKWPWSWVETTGGHMTLCDPSMDAKSPVKNPTVCGDDDCYELFVISTGQRDNGNARQFMSTPVRVRVANPKTPEAKIVELIRGKVIRGHTFPFKKSFFEPVVAGDGRLLVGRSFTPFSWTNQKGNSVSGMVNNMYLVNDNPDAFAACDVRQWDKAYPLVEAPYDDTINDRYGFAMQQFTDTRGNVIPQDDYLLGSYPWIDRKADNISITTNGSFALYDPKTGVSEFETMCVTADCVPKLESQRLIGARIRIMMGLWTRGKAVVLDGIVNHTDYDQGSVDKRQRLVKMYKPFGGKDGFVRIGNGRNIGEAGLPASASGNNNFFDTNEHRFYFMKTLKPGMPRDVVWRLNTGISSDEFAFDDYLDIDSFIIANMNYSAEIMNGRLRPATTRVQNSATSSKWNLPEYGQVEGNGRIERTANGGINGKGFWLDGASSGLSFDIPSQPRHVGRIGWYAGIFVDIRDSRPGYRTLFTFPDNSSVKLLNESNRKQVAFFDDQGQVIHAVDASSYLTNGNWMHLGLNIGKLNRRIRIFLNGIRVDSFKAPHAVFQLTEGKLYVGINPYNSGDNLRAWVDDFKVFSRTESRELACNHANGTLVAVSEGAPSYWQSIAKRTPKKVNRNIAKILEQDSEESKSHIYACYLDYSGDHLAHLGNIPNGMESVREALIFPEGPVMFDKPRPESRANGFCLTCHTADGKKGLDLDALALRKSVNAQHDERRQPMQPDAHVYGVIPQNWLGQGLPSSRIAAEAINGYLIDNLVLPR